LFISIFSAHLHFYRLFRFIFLDHSISLVTKEDPNTTIFTTHSLIKTLKTMKLKLLKATTYLEGNGTIADDLCRNKPEPAASEVTKEAVKRNSHIELLILHKKLASSPRLPKNSSTTVFLETIGSSNNKIQDKGTISNQSFSPFIGRANTATVVLVTKSLLGIVDSSGKEMVSSSIHL